MLTVLGLLVGFIIGYFSKGITINVNKDPDDSPEAYNESLAHLLDQEQREYFDQTNGIIKG